MSTPAIQLYTLLSELRILIKMPQGYDYDKLADGFDLTSSLHCIRRFLVSGEALELEQGVQRLEQVIARKGKRAMESGRQKLFSLKQLAKCMSESDRHDALVLFEEGLTSAEWISKHTPPERIDLLVVAALLEPELRCFVDQLSECREIVGSEGGEMVGLTYYEGFLRYEEIGGRKPIRVIASFQDQPGLTDCAALVANGIRLFRPRMVALTGVCAGRQKMGVRKTDLVIPSAVFTYDTGKHTDRGFEQEPRWCDVDPKIIRRVRSQGPSVLASIAKRIKSVGPNRLRTPQIHTDVMACGAAVVDKEGMINEIAGANRKVVGLDMESYALLRASRLTNERIGSMVVKGVMDFATGKSDNVKEQAAFWAAAFIAQFLTAEFEKLCPYDG